MHNRLIGVAIAVLCLGSAYMLSTPTAVVAQTAPAAATATEDVLHMRDGRVLHGKILNETRLLIIFEYTDTALKATTRLTLAKDDIAKVEKGVPVAAQPATEAPTPTTPTASPTKPETTSPQPTHVYGTSRATDASSDAAKFYIIPMKGQMGTDVNSEIYQKVINDIKALKPDVIVIQMNCQDVDDIVFNEKRQEEQGLVEFDEYRTLVRLFSTELRDFRQVCWVHDSVGISSMVALAWNEIYMTPKARFGGLDVARSTGFESWRDEDVRGKMTAAFMAIVKGFLETGGHALLLADAMIRPQFTLSASWKGRDVIWSLDDKGEYLVDGSDRRTVQFRSKAAEDFGISKGTAETLDDLALLMGYREYRVLDGQAEKMCEEYVRNWRRAFEDIKVLMQDYQQFLGWATGQDAIKYLGRAISTLEKILNYLERYKPLEIRLAQQFGMTKNDLTVLIEQHKETLRGMRRGGGAAGGGGSGPSPGRGGVGG